MGNTHGKGSIICVCDKKRVVSANLTKEIKFSEGVGSS